MIVHLIRYSMRFASWKERKVIATTLKPICRVSDADAALAELEAFEASELDHKYPAIVASWRRNWEAVFPFFAFSPGVRRIVYSTNAIESLHNQVRKAVRSRGYFPNDKAASKAIYLVLKQVEAKWKNPPIPWQSVKTQLAIQFGERFKPSD